jgi:hypothetical protein
MRRRRKIFVCNKWLGKSEGVPYKEVINCTNVLDLKRLENTYTKLYVNGRLEVVRYN